MSGEKKQPIIFCDFDGTITKSDNIVSLVQHFAPSGWESIMKDIVQHNISIRQGVGDLFALFPSIMKEQILAYVLETATIREGFAELIEFTRAHHIPFLVTSGGIDFFILPLLAPFNLEPEQIYCNGSDFSGEKIKILWPHPCDEHCHVDCGMCKMRIIRSYPVESHFRILIGDSLTDFEGAKLADLVFARSHLIERCKETGLNYIPFEQFHSIVDYLNKEVLSK